VDLEVTFDFHIATLFGFVACVTSVMSRHSWVSFYWVCIPR